MLPILQDAYHVFAIIGAFGTITGIVGGAVFVIRRKANQQLQDHSEQEWKSLAEARGEIITDLATKIEHLETRVSKLEDRLEDKERENEQLRRLNLDLQRRLAS